MCEGKFFFGMWEPKMFCMSYFKQIWNQTTVMWNTAVMWSTVVFFLRSTGVRETQFLMWETVVVKELHWCRNTVIFACSVMSACSVDFALDWCGQGWTEVCFRLQRFGYRMQVRTLPGELRMSGFRIHSHAQLSSCGHLGTPETAKLLHSTPACVCVRVETVHN